MVLFSKEIVSEESKMATMQPVKFTPACKGYLWGGTKLREQFGVNCDMDPLAEAWVLSAHKDGQSVVKTGEFAGCTLMEYIQKAGEVCGGNAARFADFPVLIKLIDAKQQLSVQVHPDDTFARANEGGNGKTEMWYVLSADEGAALYYGFNKQITADEVRARIADGTLDDVLNAVPVKAGDVFFLPPGTVHAIGAGMVICEIQQNSNTTYRLYDYNRRDKDGNLRELHVEKALKVSDLCPAPVKGGTGDILADCEYFRVQRVKVCGEKIENITPASFHSLVAVAGSGTLKMHGETLELQPGDSVFIPAQKGTYTLSGDMTLVLTDIPE